MCSASKLMFCFDILAQTKHKCEKLVLSQMTVGLQTHHLWGNNLTHLIERVDYFSSFHKLNIKTQNLLKILLRVTLKNGNIVNLISYQPMC